MSIAQPARSENVKAIVNYFESGIKQESEPERLGVELEHILVYDDMSPVSYSDERGVRWILEQLNETYPDRIIDGSGNLIGVGAADRTVTIEPAGQLELSAGPFENVGEIRYEFEEFQRDLSHLLQQNGTRALAVGYHPTARAQDLELIPKQRYHFMDEHFAHIGTFGRCMMRGSAATQISIDYRSVDDCLRKLRLAGACAPLFALMCDNSPVFEGEPRAHQMVRTEIWLECDPARCGIVPGAMSENFTLEDYANYVLDTPAIVKRLDDETLEATNLTFGELFADTAMNRAQVEYALSLFFNDVRLKTYIEIRPADSVPVPYVAAYAALVKGLFYSDDNLSAMDELFAGVTEADILQAKHALMEDGFDATVYGKPASEIIDKLVALAHEALATNEKNYLSPLQQVAKTHRTLAMMGEKKQR